MFSINSISPQTICGDCDYRGVLDVRLARYIHCLIDLSARELWILVGMMIQIGLAHDVDSIPSRRPDAYGYSKSSSLILQLTVSQS